MPRMPSPPADVLRELNRDIADYAAWVRRAFAQLAEGTLLDIDFRFTERFATGGNAIERGVYHLAVTPPRAEPRLQLAGFPHRGRQARRHLADPRLRPQLRRRALLHRRARPR
jgi:hypothetical protein